jgi:predicted nuclease of restriction endonuclease-like (RecB) superfamily
VGHNLVLLTKLKDNELRLRYAAATVEHGWSRHILTMQIEAKTVERQGKAVTNFDRTLPAGQSDLARESLKDPYKLDFLGLEEGAREREIEQALVDPVADFLIELGAGFAYVGRQVHLEVGVRTSSSTCSLPSQAPRLCRDRGQGRQVQA